MHNEEKRNIYIYIIIYKQTYRYGYTYICKNDLGRHEWFSPLD